MLVLVGRDGVRRDAVLGETANGSPQSLVLFRQVESGHAAMVPASLPNENLGGRSAELGEELRARELAPFGDGFTEVAAAMQKLQTRLQLMLVTG